ncbi:MAG: PKD domain-containing protein [Salinivirgaceae bacterium]|nr:PKD domain-containing protein [Salinivirgaceae bacterium]
MKLLKLFVLIVFCFGLFGISNAQNPLVKGSVKYFADNSPVVNHPVSFTMPPLEIIFTTTTDEEGAFSLDFDFTSDSIYLQVKTVDPCTGDDHVAYVFPFYSNNYIEFVVCEDSTVWEPCQAAFEYSNGTRFDSVNYEIDSLGNMVYFYDHSNGNISDWQWDFGDGSTSTEQNPIHIYESEGEYLVSLVVSGDSCQSETSMSVNIGNSEPGCMAMFDYFYYNNGDSVYYENDSLEFAVNTVYFYDHSIGNISDWQWNFGDGSTSTEQNPIHIYETEGEYLVSLAVSGDSCQSETSMSVYIGNTEPDCQAMFDYYVGDFRDDSTNNDSLINEGIAVYFYEYSFGSINNWNWEFGDGSTSTEKNPVHYYQNEGEYFVSLTVSGNNCESQITMSVLVEDFNPDCMAIFGYDYFNWNDSTFMDSTETEFMTLYFYDYSYGNPTNWNWNFGDGTTSLEQNPVHTYSDAGNYTVSLNINSENCQSEYYMDVMVGNYMDTIWQPEDCMAMFYPIIKENNMVEFKNESYGEIEMYHWDFGDGSWSEEENPIHTYNEFGEYMVTLNIETVDSCTSYFEMYLYVGDYPYEDSLSAFFVPEIIGTRVLFHDRSEGEVWNRYWDFGDGESSTAKDPIHVYDDLGTYIVTLGVANANAVNTYTVEINLATGSFIGYFGSDNTTGILEDENLESIMVYPLPLQKTVTLSLNSDKAYLGEIHISSISGNTLMHQSIDINKGENNKTIDVNHLENGMYIMQIIANGEIIATKKLIK